MLRKAIAGLALAVTAIVAGAQTADAKGELVGPYWNPASKSYIALMDSVDDGLTWYEAAEAATTHWHRGVQGRLAIIPNQETHMFITDKFRREMNGDTWIGLRYFCSFRKLLWIDGGILAESPPGIWNPQWFRNKSTTCGRSRQTYMPVYYTGASGWPTWQASGQIKRFYDYLIEFPTGKP